MKGAAGDQRDDEVLMALLAGGELHALDVLMERWMPRLASFLARSLGDRVVAEELAQETMVRIYQNRSKYRIGSRFAPYLFSIAVHLLKNHQRWMRRHPSMALMAEGVGDRIVESRERWDESSDDPSIRMERAEALQRVRTALRQLPDDWRDVLLLSTVEGLEHGEIAKVVGGSVKAVESKIYRARQRLRELLERDELRSWPEFR